MFPFVLIVENTDDNTFERVTGAEQGRAKFGEKKKTIPAIQIEPHRPERAVWGRRHPGHPFSTFEELHPRPRFAYGGVWYDNFDAWRSAWGATVIERVPCDRVGEPVSRMAL